MADQRLPIVNSDDGTWGDILRQYLQKEHYDSGTNNSENGGHKNVTIRGGTAGTGGAPLKFTSGTLLTTPEVGAMEFAGDNLYLTQTSSTTRKKIALYNDAGGATGDTYYRDASGYFTRLGIGSSSQVLTVSGGLPTWQTPGTASTFSDSMFTLQDNGDTTKQARFELSGISASNTRTITLPDADLTLVGTTTSQTLINKRINPRVVTVTQSATPAFNTDNGDVFIVTGLAQAITSMTSGLTGTPVDGQRIRISITGTAARAITWGTSFEASTKPLPTTTVSTNRLDTDFIWNATTSKWRVADEIPATVLTSSAAVTVAQGGTGRTTSTTAYGIIAAGTTATGAHQTIAPGTSGQFLKSAGTSALGAFASITAADITGTTAQFNTALSDGDFATLAGSETLTNKTLTTPRFASGGSIADNNGNEQIVFTTTTSAVNEIGITNAATGTAPQIAARGDDTNIDLNLVSKGTGTVKINGNTVATDASVVKLMGIVTKSDYSGTGGTIYFKIATLPIDDNGNYATLKLTGRLGGWVGVESVADWNITLNNRSSSLNGTTITATVFSQGHVTQALTKMDIVVYGQTDKSAIVYFAIPNDSYYTYDMRVSAFQATIDHTGTTITPTGSQIWQLSADPQVLAQDGALVIANRDSTPWSNASFLALSAGNATGLKISSQFNEALAPIGHIEFTNGTGTGTHDLMLFSTSTISMQSHRLINVTNPTDAQDAATKAYVDSAVSGSGLAWTEVTGTSQTAATGMGYIASNATLVTITLPSSAAVGKSVRITGKGAGGWRIAQNASQVIHFGNTDTTTGTGGRLDSTNRYDSVELICITANTDWVVASSVGNINVT